MKKYRSIFLSDIHLGTEHCKADVLLDFLNNHDCDFLYLVGDIIDGWALQRKFYWPQSHNDVVRKFMSKARNGTHVRYITGNHDEFLRNWVEYKLVLGNISIMNERVHITADGKNYLVIHGDQYDIITVYHKWLALLGDRAYGFLLWANTKFNKIRNLFGYKYWSLSQFLKYKVKTAVNYISNFENALIKTCFDKDYDGVICGHIHYPTISSMTILSDPPIIKKYINCGDWVESCSAIIEELDGTIKLIKWNKNE